MREERVDFLAKNIEWISFIKLANVRALPNKAAIKVYAGINALGLRNVFITA